MQLQGASILVTGGASGLGAATARRLAAAGAKITVADLNEAQGLAIAAELGGQFVRCDVTQEVDAQAAVAAAQRLGELRGLVNCAGIAVGERVVGRDGPADLARFTKVIMINLVGTFNMIRVASEAMCKQTVLDSGPNERGVIINTASVAAYDGQIGQAAYSASKGGVVGMTLPIARELARFGIRVMTIAPGIFETPMMGSMSKEIQDSLGAAVPFPQRLGKPSEYAQLAHHIFENEMLNGEVIRLDGAIRLAPK
jgi:NAD(P)-dependent dehydrogenase (short-subunit alcohol dehydrogenase family)